MSKKASGFKPGQSGNPKGRARLPPNLRGIKLFSQGDAKRVISNLFGMDQSAIVGVAASQEMPMIEVAIANVILKAAEDGDIYRLTPLLDRCCGKVKEEIALSVNHDEEIDQILEGVPEGDVMAFLRRTLETELLPQ